MYLHRQAINKLRVIYSGHICRGNLSQLPYRVVRVRVIWLLIAVSKSIEHNKIQY